jgi:hypothetical protein
MSLSELCDEYGALRHRGRLFKRGDQLGDPAVVTASDDLERLVVVQRRSGLAQPDGDVAGVDDAGKSLDQGGQLDEALGALTGRSPSPAEPGARGDGIAHAARQKGAASRRTRWVPRLAAKRGERH